MNEINGIELVLIPGGSFLMGSPDGEGFDDEHPRHRVTVPAFYMGKYPVTQAQYESVMGENPSHFTGKSLPVEKVSWHNAVAFCEKLSQSSGKTFRLPTEAEWEYACRAGTTTQYCFGDDKATLGDYAWFDGNSEMMTHPIGTRKPNPWDLYDMHGNVLEWCQDRWHKSYQGAPTDGSAWLSGEDDDSRLLRGGSWDDLPRNCRSASRNSYHPDGHLNAVGFRVVCEEG